MKKILVVALSIVVALGITSCGKGKKADYPKKGVTMICPWGVLVVERMLFLEQFVLLQKNI
ncbi:hypothetical protein HRO26_08125 [Treponema pectinovorum]|uniref:hypothetical protein n=1 Tax=Treponema pectinovorum TaxID=164 RepID=UPI003D8F0363